MAYIDRGQLVRLDRATGHFLPFLNGVSADGVAFSRDGQWVAWSAWPERTIWRSRADGTDRRQLSFAPGKAVSPRWSPDGTAIAFTDMPSDPAGHTTVMLVSREGGAATEVDSNGVEIALATWSPDGVLAAGAAAWLRHWSPDSTIRVIDPATHSVSVVPGSRGYWAPKWSPDGRYIWAEHVNSHQFALLDRSTGVWTPPIEAGGVIGYGAWSHDSRFVYFNLNDYGTVFRVAAKGGRPEKVLTVRDFDAANTLGRWFGLAPDDSPLFLRDTSVNEIFALQLDRERPFP
jgi:Tol biopolymer transport system component